MDSVEFDFHGNAVRVVTIMDEPWWVARDVCDALVISNARDALAGLDDDEKTQVTMGVANTDTPQTVNVINEPGLYSLILRSRKPEAKMFKRWVTHDVLPAIRKQGGYVVPGSGFGLDHRTIARQFLRGVEYPNMRRRGDMMRGTRAYAALVEVEGQDYIEIGCVFSALAVDLVDRLNQKPQAYSTLLYVWAGGPVTEMEIFAAPELDGQWADEVGVDLLRVNGTTLGYLNRIPTVYDLAKYKRRANRLVPPPSRPRRLARGSQ